MRRWVPVLICALLLVATTCGAVPAGAQPASEETRLEAQLQQDGDARWSIVTTIPLEDEDDVRHFRSFANSFEQGERDFPLGTDTFRRAAEESSKATGREMTIHSERREATIVNETDGDEVRRYGKLRVSFTWESFARTDENGTMYVDDAFNTTDGTWLRTLDEGQTLVIRAPPGYGGPTTAPIGAQEGDLRWEGPRTFEPGYFEIVYPKTDSGFDFSTLLLVGAVVLSGAALLLGVYLLWGRDDRPGPVPGGGAATESANAGPDGESSGASEAARGAAAAGAAAGSDGDADEDDEAADLELLSDEERVEYLLERNGGRMKQANIVKETGWSNAKVSQLLSSMDDADRIDKLRIGRENLISFPDEDVTDTNGNEP
jgi:hypothetical protein